MAIARLDMVCRINQGFCKEYDGTANLLNPFAKDIHEKELKIYTYACSVTGKRLKITPIREQSL